MVVMTLWLRTRRRWRWMVAGAELPDCSGYWVAVDQATGAVRATSGSPHALAVLLQDQALGQLRIICMPQPPVPYVAPQSAA